MPDAAGAPGRRAPRARRGNLIARSGYPVCTQMPTKMQAATGDQRPRATSSLRSPDVAVRCSGERRPAPAGVVSRDVAEREISISTAAPRPHAGRASSACTWRTRRSYPRRAARGIGGASAPARAWSTASTTAGGSSHSPLKRAVPERLRARARAASYRVRSPSAARPGRRRAPASSAPLPRRCVARAAKIRCVDAQLHHRCARRLHRRFAPPGLSAVARRRGRGASCSR